MPVYAKGKRALAISDRSGFRIPYKNLKTEWTGLRVSPEDYEPKNPQLTPAKNIVDATALFKPRPDNDPDNAIVNMLFDGFNSNSTSLDSTQYDQPTLPAGKGSIGSTYVINIDILISATGVAGTGAVGTETLQAIIEETGVAGTGAIGTETPQAAITETGVAGTGAIGTETPQASITETGVAGTGAIGTESIDIDNPTWGTGAWDGGSWGE